MKNLSIYKKLIYPTLFIIILSSSILIFSSFKLFKNFKYSFLQIKQKEFITQINYSFNKINSNLKSLIIQYLINKKNNNKNIKIQIINTIFKNKNELIFYSLNKNNNTLYYNYYLKLNDSNSILINIKLKNLLNKYFTNNILYQIIILKSKKENFIVSDNILKLISKKTNLLNNNIIYNYPLKNKNNRIIAYIIFAQNANFVKYEITKLKNLLLKNLILIILICNFLIFIFIYYISTFEITRPIKKLTYELINKNSNNESKLKPLKDPNRKDEIGLLIKIFNNYIIQLKKYIDRKNSINNFKKLIESEEELNDIYNRFKNLLENKFNIKKYIMFEIKYDSEEMIPIINTCKDYKINEKILTNANLCLAKKRAELISSLDNNFDKVCHRFTSDKYKHLCIPLITGSGINFVILILTQSEKELIKILQISEELTEYLNSIAPILETKKLLTLLKQETITDPLTKCYNRRFIETYIKKLLALTTRLKSNIGFLMIDIDNFKKINDTYGHDVGDFILKETAFIIKKEIRESDVAVRYGGEEFLVILNNVKDINKVHEIAERIRLSISEKIFSFKNHLLNITVSIGYSIYSFTEDGPTDNIQKYIKAADKGLYTAKETGKNKCIKGSFI